MQTSNDIKMLKSKNIVALDFETYYDKDYSLSKLSTSEYVRDERFKAQCVGIKVGTDNVVWIPDKNVREALHSIDWKNYALLAHHTQFDGFILTERYGLTPGYYLCTLSMGRALHSVGMGAALDDLAKYYKLGHKVPNVLAATKGVRDLPIDIMQDLGFYCMVDTQLCSDLYWQMVNHVSQSELDLINETCRMFCEPVLMVDIPRAYKALELEKEEKRQKIKASLQDPIDLRSNDKFAGVLRSLGVDPPLKISKTTGKETYAFAKSDEGFQKLQVHEDELVCTIIEARMAVKSSLVETRAQRIITAGNNGQRVPVYLKYYGAHTGRWSAGNKMNLQNLPRGSELRKSLIAPPGYVLVVADSAQIEARVLAWLADEKEMLQQFRNKEDVYIKMAAEIYEVPVEEISKKQRFVGKVATLGLGYQMGWRRFQASLLLGLMGPKMELEVKEAREAVFQYRTARKGIVDYWGKCEEMIKLMMNSEEKAKEFGVLTVAGEEKKIYLPNGMYLEYPGVSDSSRGVMYFDYENASRWDYGKQPDLDKGRKIYGGSLTENITQALARIIVGEQILKVSERYRIITMSHDEIVAMAPEDKAEEALEFMLEMMRTPPDWALDLPLDAEGGFAREYSK